MQRAIRVFMPLAAAAALALAPAGVAHAETVCAPPVNTGGVTAQGCVSASASPSAAVGTSGGYACGTTSAHQACWSGSWSPTADLTAPGGPVVHPDATVEGKANGKYWGVWTSDQGVVTEVAGVCGAVAPFGPTDPAGCANGAKNCLVTVSAVTVLCET